MFPLDKQVILSVVTSFFSMTLRLLQHLCVTRTRRKIVPISPTPPQKPNTPPAAARSATLYVFLIA